MRKTFFLKIEGKVLYIILQGKKPYQKKKKKKIYKLNILEKNLLIRIRNNNINFKSLK